MLGARMGFVWAKLAWVRTGYLSLGPMWVLCGQSGHGFKLVIHVWGRCGLMWAWIRTSHPCLGSLWVVYWLNGHGLQLVIHVWVPCGLCVGHVSIFSNGDISWVRNSVLCSSDSEFGKDLTL